MTAAYRLKGVGRLGLGVVVVLGFYLVSLQVAATRKRLDEVNSRIASAERDIRALETEFDTRANLAQLEKWNGDTLALTAPVARQFVTDEAALAQIDVAAPMAPDTQVAALLVPSLPTPAAATSPVGAATPAPAVAEAAVIRVAAVTKPLSQALTAPTLSGAPAAEGRRTERARTVAAVAKVRPQAVAMLDRKLLSDSTLLSDKTLGDILASAKTEAGRRR